MVALDVEDDAVAMQKVGGAERRLDVVRGVPVGAANEIAPGVHIAFITKGNLIALRRNHIVAHPQRLGRELESHCDQDQEKEFFHMLLAAQSKRMYFLSSSIAFMRLIPLAKIKQFCQTRKV